jgi:glycogen operon protein
MRIEVWPGRPWPRGASWDGAGVNFAVYSQAATRVEVCLFDARDPAREIARFDLPENTEFTWHGYVPELEPGALYGIRVHGPWAPGQGHRCNPHKLLVDPYARALSGALRWDPALFGHARDNDLQLDTRDSAPFVPRAVVVDGHFDWQGDRALLTPWRKTILYELHVRGFTKLHPAIPERLRGTYAGLAHPAAIDHLTRLGVTAVELLPVQEFIDDEFLVARGLSNYWGYNPLAYFAPALRYASRTRPGAVVAEFKAMVRALHQAGIEVIVDVVYNHTCEGNQLGPTLSLKGIDNARYYALADDPRYYRDHTGCGNSLCAAQPATLRLITDSLRYWAEELHVDGFRFDLATTLGRNRDGAFQEDAALFQIIEQDPILSRLKLIAEPWDLGADGYRVGRFPSAMREWNGKYRDAIRRFWRGDENLAGEVGYRLSGSADLYQGMRRRPQASINFITAHDGFTLHDLVSYERKHNEANGEGNRDGNDHNDSFNCGVEGETDRADVLQLRERQKRNLLATLFLSQGVPMIVAGDELGRTQRGNNNAYCQDNPLSWLDWSLDERRRRMLAFTRRLIRFRHEQPVLQRLRFFRGEQIWDSQFKDLAWFRPDGSEMTREDWERPFTRAFAFLLGRDAVASFDELGHLVVGEAVLVLMNAYWKRLRFVLPRPEPSYTWRLALDTAGRKEPNDTQVFEAAGRSVAVFVHARADETSEDAS